MRPLIGLDYVIIIAYLGALTFIGFHFSRRQKSRTDYYLVGRSLHWTLAGGSIIATLLSTISYLSVPGEMIRYGVGFFASVLAIPLVIPVIGRVLIQLPRLAEKRSIDFVRRKDGP